MALRKLPDEELDQIAESIPDLRELFELLLKAPPDFLSAKFPPESDIPVASVCLTDCLYSLSDACYALHQAHANRIHYSSLPGEGTHLSAVWFERYYLDDVALRLYAAGEHLANAIQMMLEIPSASIRRGKTDVKGSWQASVGKYLVAENPNHPIAIELCALSRSDNWTAVIEYRNKWVHSQPPPLAGLGLVYRRRKRWTVSGTHRSLVMGVPDAPELTIEQLRALCSGALHEFVGVFRNTVDFYEGILVQAGYQ